MKELAWVLVTVGACSGGTEKESDNADSDVPDDTVPDTLPDTDTDAGDTDTDPPDTDTVDTDAPVTGTDFAVYYVAWPGPGFDQRYPVTATHIGGAMQSYVASPDESPEIGSCSALDVGVHGSVAWGRWADGETAGTYYGNTYVFGPENGWHYALLDTPVTSGAFGVAGAWAQVGATSTTTPGGDPVGTTTWEAVMVPGDPPQLALSMTATVGGTTLQGATPGWPDAAKSKITWFNGSFAGGMDLTGCPAPGPCTLSVRGRFADGGETMALMYTSVPDQWAGVAVLAAP